VPFRHSGMSSLSHPADKSISFELLLLVTAAWRVGPSSILRTTQGDQSTFDADVGRAEPVASIAPTSSGAIVREAPGR
jgi:hypothetical protein